MPRKIPYGQQLFLLSLAGGLPALVIAGTLLVKDVPPVLAWTLLLPAAALWLGFAGAVYLKVIRPLQSLSNLILALREEDYSFGASAGSRDDPLGAVFFEINALSETLREQRLGALEATALLRSVMGEISVAVFAFDEHQRLRLVNRAGERLLGRPAERLLDQAAADLGLAECLQGEPVRTLQAGFAGGLGRWGIRRTSFRQRGRPHQLLVMADLSLALREEERQAWKRLLRVLGHELNNSLAPIKSISATLIALLGKDPPPPDWREDLTSGLGVISARAEALSRFMQDYSRLARLPQPQLQSVELAPLIHRVLSLETRLAVQLTPGPDLTLQADPDQLEQMLINLLRNAVDAALQTKGAVRLSWARAGACLELRLEDEGPGLANTANLFVPFFTTKPGGSGIGLALSRQIAEAHGGTLALENRPQGSGCLARFTLPLRVEPRPPPQPEPNGPP